MVTGNYLPVKDCRSKQDWAKAGLVISQEALDWALDRIAEVIGALDPQELRREAHPQAA